MGTFLDDLETIPRTEREAYQGRRLAEMVRLGHERSSRVRKIFAEQGITPADIRTINDLAKLPVINREQLVEIEAAEPPYGGLEDPPPRWNASSPLPDPSTSPTWDPTTLCGQGRTRPPGSAEKTSS